MDEHPSGQKVIFLVHVVNLLVMVGLSGDILVYHVQSGRQSMELYIF